jgi:hypothetical protein
MSQVNQGFSQEDNRKRPMNAPDRSKLPDGTGRRVGALNLLRIGRRVGLRQRSAVGEEAVEIESRQVDVKQERMAAEWPPV